MGGADELGHPVLVGLVVAVTTLLGLGAAHAGHDHHEGGDHGQQQHTGQRPDDDVGRIGGRWEHLDRVRDARDFVLVHTLRGAVQPVVAEINGERDGLRDDVPGSVNGLHTHRVLSDFEIPRRDGHRHHRCPVVVHPRDFLGVGPRQRQGVAVEVVGEPILHPIDAHVVGRAGGDHDLVAVEVLRAVVCRRG